MKTIWKVLHFSVTKGKYIHYSTQKIIIFSPFETFFWTLIVSRLITKHLNIGKSRYGWPAHSYYKNIFPRNRSLFYFKILCLKFFLVPRILGNCCKRVLCRLLCLGVIPDNFCFAKIHARPVKARWVLGVYRAPLRSSLAEAFRCVSASASRQVECQGTWFFITLISRLWVFTMRVSSEIRFMESYYWAKWRFWYCICLDK